MTNKHSTITEYLVGRRGAASGEEGQAVLILLAGMMLAILAMTVLIVRIGHANDLRSKAKHAADAAALAGASRVRDKAMDDIFAGYLTYWLMPPASSEKAAEDYAKRNGAIVTQYEAAMGPAVQVTVRTADCQKVEKSPGYHVEPSCRRTDDSKKQTTKNKEKSATATSSAAISLPNCRRIYSTLPHGKSYWSGIDCGNLQVISRSRSGKIIRTTVKSTFAKLFTVHLVKGIQAYSGPGGDPGPLPTGKAGKKAENNQNIAKKLIEASNGKYRGWNGDEQRNCLIYLWNKESGWLETAINKSSGAFGIPQALDPATKIMNPPGSRVAMKVRPASVDKKYYPQNAAAQIAWGLNYVKQRYQTPCSAWAFHRANGWY